ncbi:TetR/AcrR family transcriptional regulator [Paenibacillus sp. Y412MC10]|uniref:TetR/AcrR family transcriptional regulator n=1 Tax=Geobacillus sp. (strain Y412MC10) TaxID=481743 RepID=UPI0001788AAE|nr:helix-turn-helix domain-containing protein [Paenibacillus sp. Y412MC10]ACX62661.1 transcriptional regulator, TetR family [Paenibacillus sp. Y412MC10]
MNPETRNARTQLIIEAAERVFTHKGIEKATMQDVATEAAMGVATVFRFFPRKEKLVVAVATKMLETVLETFRSVAEQPISCMEKLELLFDHFISLLEQQTSSNVKLLENFESYAAQFTEPLEDIELFNAVYRDISQVFSTIVEQGIEDGSVQADLPIAETLTTIVNTFGIFARKLSLQKNILVVEPDLAQEKQLAILKHILLNYLRA